MEIEIWSCAVGLPTSRLLICLMIAASQSLAFLFTSAITWSKVRWTQSRSCAAQTLPSSGGLSMVNDAGLSRVASGGAATMPVPSTGSKGWNEP